MTRNVKTEAETDLAAHARWTGEGGRSRVVFAVEGMRCAGCARSIEKAVRALPGVEAVEASAATGRVAVDWRADQLALGPILRAVREAGFRVVPLAGERAQAAYQEERRTALKRIGLAGLGMMQVMMLVYGLYAVGPRGIDPGLAHYLRLAAMLIATPVLLYSGAPFFSAAWSQLRRRSLGMDVPVAVALSLAFAASVFNTLRGEGEVYFDSVTMFIFFLLTGRYVEMAVRHRSLSSSEALARSLPATVLRVRADGSTERVPVESIVAGDRLSIPKGALIPVDAEVLDEVARVDESLVTGESTPVTRRAGEPLMGGSVNVGEAVRVLARSDVANSTIAALVALLERGRAQRPRLGLLADRAAAWFVAGILVLAVVVALSWALVDPARAFPATLAVLVVTCPCALSLATPTALAAATSRLAKSGLLVTGPDAIERLARVDTVIIDKTGTLTSGLRRAECRATFGSVDPARALALAAALERGSDHPLAAAFSGFDDPAIEVSQLREYPGQGLEGRIDGRTWRLGRPEFVRALTRLEAFAAGATDREDLEDALYLGDERGLVASFTVKESLRDDARAAVEALREMGLEVVIASGDAQEAVTRVGRELGITQAQGRLTPQEKVAIVHERQRRGHRVLMLGDGINDGPVLAAADVSCAMGEGSAIAQAAADLLLLERSLRSVATAIATSRHALRIVRQNLAWALAYNVCAVPLAAFGFVPPWVAAIGMSASSLVVVLNARRLAAARASARPAAPPIATPAAAMTGASS